MTLEQPSPVTVDATELRAMFARVRSEVGKAVVGQDGAVTGLIISLLAGGHVLLEGVPGVAKTLVVRAFARALGLETKRVQFTPDLMPGDVTGSLVYDARTGEFEFRAGPVFTNILLADEINRTPPKTQAALLEAMEERQVSADGVSRDLPDPFLVAATQNPIEHEGTYSLPEAQLDRFLMKLVVGMPERDAELTVLRLHAGRTCAASRKQRQQVFLGRMIARRLRRQPAVVEQIRGTSGRDDFRQPVIECADPVRRRRIITMAAEFTQVVGGAARADDQHAFIAQRP